MLVDSALAVTLALAGADSVAQRPALPINRPPRPGGPIGPGRFPLVSDGVIRTQPPGVFVVRAVNDRDNILQLAGAEGRTGNVYVPPEVFDVAELKPGDEIVVDFVVPADGNARLVAAAIWRN
ncbi:MAG TPA: hypothetical protein VFK10_00960 [Burkholderiaceae bacterium]|nr:hypothetical protein [Burkholderiaceae bacterium]